VDIDKYVKIVYQTAPIGEYEITLYLTTFDLEAYERDKNLKEIPLKTVYCSFPVNRGVTDTQSYMDYIQKQINNRIDGFYRKELEEMKKYIEGNRLKEKFFAEVREIEPTKIIKGNITNSDNIICDVIQGNVVNCDNVKVREIRGNTVNCEIYRESE
jgi:hypothetical protein